MTSMEPGATGVDPRLSFDDPLLDGLLILCKLHGATVSRASLSAGLPLNKQRLSLDLLPRAAARAGLQARLLRRDLKDISPLNLPILLLLNDGRTAVPRRFGEDGKALAEQVAMLGLSADQFNRAQMQALVFADKMEL